MSRIDPHSYFDTEQPWAKHIRLRWHVDFTTQQIIGDTTLVFEQPSAGQVDLDSKGLTITSVQIRTGSNVPYTLGDADPILGRQLTQWEPRQVLVFLQHLPRQLDTASLAWLDAQLGLMGRGNYEILVEWLTIAAGSDYQPVFGRLREVLTRVGRMKFLRPLFVALGQHARPQQLEREIYDAAQETYHSLSRRVIEATMAQWETT